MSVKEREPVSGAAADKLKKFAVFTAASLLCAVVLLFLVWRLCGWEIHFTYSGEKDITTQYGAEPPELQVRAYCCGKHFLKDGFEIPVTSEPESFSTYALGKTTIHYTASYLGVKGTLDRTITVADEIPPQITLDYTGTGRIGYGEAYEEEGYTAWDGCDGELTAQVEREDQGNGWIRYSVQDAAGNRAFAWRWITWEDITAPVIMLLGDSTMTLEAGTYFEEPGYAATDDVDGDRTAAVLVTQLDDQVIYSVADSAGNTTTVSRSLVWVDTTPPELLLAGDSELTIQAGDDFTDPGYTATDLADGDLSGAVTIDGEVDRYTAGDYTLTYSVADSSGNTATADRIVHVLPAPQQTVQQNPGNKVVYLTFDDGPGAYTQQLLDVLAKYNVKATFFVTNQYPGYQYLIAAESAAGHSVGIHSYSHNYKVIYQSEDDFFADVESMQAVVVSQTGSRSALLRFPGGSSNTVSSYNPGIMTRLTTAVRNAGYQYFDWNVSSGDAGETTDTDTVAQNVINGIQQHNVSIVLQHDIKSYSVAAVEKIITWGLANGYTFLPLNTDSPSAHHGINN